VSPREWAEVLSAVCGLVSALILAIPALAEVSSRQRWEQLSEIETGGEGQPDPESIARVWRAMVDARLGHSRYFAKIAIAAYASLLAAFALLLVATFLP
jgi:hypothetical protein